MELQSAFNQILYQDHPSIGTQRAVFMFAIGKGPTRILTVEATNPWAVLCLERLLLTDGKASDNCRVLQVIREYRNVGTRDEMTEEVPFMDFMLDIADMDRLLGGTDDDVLVLEAFKNALSDTERQAAAIKLEAQQQSAPRDIFAGYQSETVAAKVPGIESEGQSEKLTTALVGLGFKKADVRQFVASLGDQAHTESLHSLLRQGLRALAA